VIFRILYAETGRPRDFMPVFGIDVRSIIEVTANRPIWNQVVPADIACVQRDWVTTGDAGGADVHGRALAVEADQLGSGKISVSPSACLSITRRRLRRIRMKILDAKAAGGGGGLLADQAQCLLEDLARPAQSRKTTRRGDGAAG